MPERFDRRSLLLGGIPTAGVILLAGYGAVTETIARDQQAQKRQAFHYPAAEGQPVPPVPYLTIPFGESGLKAAVARDPNFDQLVHPVERVLLGAGVKPRQMRISQGWEYDDREFQIAGVREHEAIDIHVPYGTDVLAPADGYATATGQWLWATNPDGSKRLYQGDPIRRSPGLVVQLFVTGDKAPPLGRFVQKFHLSSIAPGIPFIEPEPAGENLNPKPGHLTIPVADIPTSSAYVRVEKGQPLGTVGNSGLFWGEVDDEYTRLDRSSGGIILPDRSRSWDVPHLHMEEFWRNQRTGAKEGRRDISSQYAQKDRYSHMSVPVLPGPDSLWVTDSNRRVVFAAA